MKALACQSVYSGSLTSRLDKVQQHVHTVVAEARVTLDPALLGENVIVLAFKVGADLAEGSLVVNGVAKARGVDNGQADASSFLVKLELDGDGLDADALLDVGGGGIIVVAALQDGLAAEGVDEGRPASTGGTTDHEAELDSLLHILLAAELERAAGGRHFVEWVLLDWRWGVGGVLLRWVVAVCSSGAAAKRVTRGRVGWMDVSGWVSEVSWGCRGPAVGMNACASWQGRAARAQGQAQGKRNAKGLARPP